MAKSRNRSPYYRCVHSLAALQVTLAHMHGCSETAAPHTDEFPMLQSGVDEVTSGLTKMADKLDDLLREYVNPIWHECVADDVKKVCEGAGIEP